MAASGRTRVTPLPKRSHTTPAGATRYDPGTRPYRRGFSLAPVALAVIVAGAVIGMNGGRRQQLALAQREADAAPADARP